MGTGILHAPTAPPLASRWWPFRTSSSGIENRATSIQSEDLPIDVARCSGRYDNVSFFQKASAAAATTSLPRAVRSLMARQGGKIAWISNAVPILSQLGGNQSRPPALSLSAAVSSKDDDHGQ